VSAIASSAGPGEDWKRLSAWCIPHFVVGQVIRSFQALVFGIPAGFGAQRAGFENLLWQVPVAVAAALTVAAVLRYLFTRYRVTDRAVEMRRGALFRRHVNVTFERIQNISIVEPFYFRLLGMANLSIDSAGSVSDEVEVPALSLSAAEELRTYIGAMRLRSLGQKEVLAATETELVSVAPADTTDGGIGDKFFTRSLRDLVIHGLTNNRAAIAIAAIMGFFFQSGISTNDIARSLGLNFDVMIAGLSLMRFAIVLVLGFLLSIVLLALLSVLVSIVSYYGFSMFRSGARLVVRRGLINRHEIAVRKSRIQLIRLSQDWLDYLLDRRNLYLEQLTHAPQGQHAVNKHVVVPSVRLSETRAVTDEIWPLEAVEELEFTPLNWRWFRKWSAVVTALNIGALIILSSFDDVHAGFVAAAIAAWPALMAIIYMTWKRGGLAVTGAMIVARSGTIGLNYRIFPTSKLQDITHVQTPFMRRHDLSSLQFMTASSRIKVPYLPGSFARQVVNYSLFDIEARPRSWM
jgi:putative membrane protein